MARLLSVSDDAIAAEKGRLLAAQQLAHDPEKRKLLEATFGLEYCKQRYPEAYKRTWPFRPLVDLLTFRRE